MNKLLVILISTLSFGAAFAQVANKNDALRYSLQNFSGTARSTAMGGSFGALGGDFVSSSTNPAGLGIYRSSEVHGTFGLRQNKTNSNGLTDHSNDFLIGSTGVVWTLKNAYQEGSRIKNLNFAVGYQQSGNFNRDYAMERKESSSSFLDVLSANAGTRTEAELGGAEFLAYHTYLIEQELNAGGGVVKYFPSGLVDGDLVYQHRSVRESGSMGETVFSFGGNFEHKLYFGATLGIQSLNYKEHLSYYEQTDQDKGQGILDNYYYKQHLQTTGIGANLKLGLIYRPIDELRFGVAMHTPTIYSMEDQYHAEIDAVFYEEPVAKKGKKFVSGFGDTFDYNYRTPWKFIFSGALILPKIGAINLDYELIDHSTSKFSDGDFALENQEIKDSYAVASNIRAGIEVRASKAFSLRAGLNYRDDVYSDSAIDNSHIIYSGGLGYKYKDLFFDLAYQYSSMDETQNYSESDTAINLGTDVHAVSFTIGHKF